MSPICPRRELLLLLSLVRISPVYIYFNNLQHLQYGHDVFDSLLGSPLACVQGPALGSLIHDEIGLALRERRSIVRLGFQTEANIMY